MSTNIEKAREKVEKGGLFDVHKHQTYNTCAHVDMIRHKLINHHTKRVVGVKIAMFL